MKYDLEKLQKEYDDNEFLEFLFFWGHIENKNYITKACLSQWYESPFIVDNTTYYTAEHYMMAEKARLFKNLELRKEIIETKKQGKVKELGRQILNFNQEMWDINKFQIVLKGNYHKFNQNQKLREFLINTKNKILAEASPLDSIWGIGLSIEDESIYNPKLWEGKNLLGFALMEVRDLM